MLRGKPLYAFIPVRGGSKGIPRKNLYVLQGISLLERTILLAKKEARISHTLVSTDDPEMDSIAHKQGVNAPSLRPAHLADSSAKTVDVILHHLDEMKVQTGYVLLLQVTTPLKNSGDLKDFLDAFEANEKATSSVSLVAHTSPHPLKLQKIENGFVQSYMGVESMVPRQELPPVYALNGAFYLASVEFLREKKSFFSAHTSPFLMPAEKSVNLDSKLDILLMEALVEKKIVRLD